MSHTQVPEIELMDDGSLVLTIEVFGFEPGARIELSGSATQANGAIATFYDFANLPPAKPDGGSILTVKAAPTSGFVAGAVITAVGRATKVWGTVLSGDSGQHPGVRAIWTAESLPQAA